MKTTYLLKSLLLGGTFLFASCSSFLDEENWSNQSAEEYYRTAQGYESLITGAYSTLKSVYNSTNYFTLTQLGTDIGTQSNATAINGLNQYSVDYQVDNGTVYNQWKTLYSALKNVNAAIERSAYVKTKDEDSFDGIEPDKLAQYVAEAKFLRALYLFEIIKNWGQAPLILSEPTTSSTESKLDSGAAFYDQILKDLNDVLDSSLPVKQDNVNFGRVSKAAAKHLRALVYLTRGYQDYAKADDFKNAYEDAVDVIKNSGHKLLDDYAMVHRQSNETNDEIIFSINFSSGSGWNNNIQTMYYLFTYREGWTDLSFSNIYCNDNASITPSDIIISFICKFGEVEPAIPILIIAIGLYSLIANISEAEVCISPTLDSNNTIL